MMSQMSDKKEVLSFRGAIRQDWPFLVLTLVSLVAGLFVYPRIQGPVPIHWNISFEPDQFVHPLWAVLGMPLGTIALYVFLVLLPTIDPRRDSYWRFAPTMRLLRLAMLTTLLGLSWISLLYGMGAPVAPQLFVQLIIGALFAVIGNSLGQVRPTFFVGVRTPWTLADERVWQRTHRIAARFWVAAGTIGMVSAFLPRPVGSILFASALGVAVVWPTLFSYLDYRRLHPPEPRQ